MLFIKKLFERSSVVKICETEEKKTLLTVKPIICEIAKINTRKQSYKRAGSMPGIQTNKSTAIVSLVIQFENLKYSNDKIFYLTINTCLFLFH